MECHREREKTSVEFLGVECRWGRDRAGRVHLKRRTARKKRRSSLGRVTEWGRERRSGRVHKVMEQVNLKRRGYDNDDGMSGNSLGLKEL